jgi:hypothetical protein
MNVDGFGTLIAHWGEKANREHRVGRARAGIGRDAALQRESFQ